MSVDGRMDDEHESYIKNNFTQQSRKNETMKFAGKWLELERTRLSGDPQMDKLVLSPMQSLRGCGPWEWL